MGSLAKVAIATSLIVSFALLPGCFLFSTPVPRSTTPSVTQSDDEGDDAAETEAASGRSGYQTNGAPR